MSKTADTHGARELALFAVNDGELYRQRILPIIENLARKIAAGRYDAAKAPTLWRYAADDAAQRYTKEFGATGPNGSYGAFDAATRQLAAVEIAAHNDEYLNERGAELTAERENRRLWPLAHIRRANEDAGHYFFSRDTLKFYGETMANFCATYHGRDIFVYRRKAGRKGGAVGARWKFNPETGAINSAREES